MRLAIIPARGGSKRIPKKNIKEFLGKPIIAYSIEKALQSACFDKVVVSTDSEEIAKVARAYGAEVPFIRPKELADDYAGTLPVIAHAVKYFQQECVQIDLLCCIYPTAPLLQIEDLQQGLEAMQDPTVQYSFSACEYKYPIFRAFRLNEQCRPEMFFPKNFSKRSQDLEKAYHDAGQFYWGRPEAFLQELPVFDHYSAPIILPHYLVQDIDTLDDWKRAELLYQSVMGQ
ncbi:MAG: NeuA [Gammaproteobacteria bacterium]|jgi:N-acylneuraminate cytidylyltransferase|nr:NeuA [Gammaproteobacteria bacterium]